MFSVINWRRWDNSLIELQRVLHMHIFDAAFVCHAPKVLVLQRGNQIEFLDVDDEQNDDMIATPKEAKKIGKISKLYRGGAPIYTNRHLKFLDDLATENPRPS